MKKIKEGVSSQEPKVRMRGIQKTEYLCFILTTDSCLLTANIKEVNYE